MEEIGLRELTLDQVEQLCEIAEGTARKHVILKVPPRKIHTLNITVDAEETKIITINVDVEVVLSPHMKNFNVEKLAKEAVEKAFASVEEYLRELSCRSKE